MVKSGLVYDYGMGFWGPNGHDGVWHVSLASSLARGTLNTDLCRRKIKIIIWI